MRPSVGLCAIMKNEEKNLPILLASVKDCFDEIYITDTGSTDNSVEVARSLGAHVSHFEWVKDFAKARNFNLSQAKTDYVMWIDLDDCFTEESRKNFLNWRDTAMHFSDLWFARYVYATDANGVPICSFTRERVMNRRVHPEWKYFIHEGLMPTVAASSNYVVSWEVTHRRSVEDLVKDKGRNLDIFETAGHDLDSRMLYYYGKELYEIGKHAEAIPILLKAVAEKDLELHDRILGIQFAGICMLTVGKYFEAINMAHQGLMLAPQRAEFWTLIGDAHIKMDNMKNAIPYYNAAKNCECASLPESKMPTAIFAEPALYTDYPRHQLATIHFKNGNFEASLKEAKESYEISKSEHAKKIIGEIQGAIEATDIEQAKDCDDIVITCAPGGAYEWDEVIAKTRGIGGSETAAIEIAKSLKKLTSRKVKIFNTRKAEFTAPSGVEYHSNALLSQYFKENKPKLHIAWRHNIKITKARTVAWSHDLIIPGIQDLEGVDQVLALSDFHKKFINGMAGIPLEKIKVTRNGIIPEKFEGVDFTQKNPNKIVWLSSPDRGLLKAINVLKKVRLKHPVELHVYYGFDNMRLAGLGALADYMMNVIKQFDWIHFHGNVEQYEMAKQIKDAALWVFPSDYLETFCISALEALACGIYPIVRNYGALPDTLREFHKNGMCTILDNNCVSEEGERIWAKEVETAIEEKKWETIKMDLSHHAWDSVATDWIKEYSL